MKTAYIEGKKWKQELQQFLLSNKSTSHATTTVARCVLLFNQTISGQSPELESKTSLNKRKIAKANIETAKQKNKAYYDKKDAVDESDIQETNNLICLQQGMSKLSP